MSYWPPSLTCAHTCAHTNEPMTYKLTPLTYFFGLSFCPTHHNLYNARHACQKQLSFRIVLSFFRMAMVYETPSPVAYPYFVQCFPSFFSHALELDFIHGVKRGDFVMMHTFIILFFSDELRYWKCLLECFCFIIVMRFNMTFLYVC